MLATECSKPEATKASRAHHRTMSLAESLRVRVAIHRARHTSMLQSTERQKSCGPVAVSLALTRLAIMAAPGPGTPGLALVASVPPASTSQANPSEPTRLPINEAIQTAASSATVTAPAARPWSMYMTLPVKSSAPAKTTSVRATPNTAPETSLVAGDPVAASGPAVLTSRTTATPT